MSEQRTQSNGTQAQEAVALPDEVLSRIVAETERQFTAKANRPSPIHLRTWDEIERFAERAANSGMVPKQYVGKPDAICIAIQMGAELGLSPMMALKGISVVNGNPSVYGDVALGLCRQSGKAVYITEGDDGRTGDDLTYWCEARRKDDPTPKRQTFSVADAKKARLWNKAGPWSEYPLRMLQMRARGFCLRDAFPDVLVGLITVEEAQDIPFEDTGLKIGLPPVATDQPITRPTEKPKRTWATLLDEIEADAAAALTEEDLDTLAKDERVINALNIASDAVANRLLAILKTHRARVQAFNAPIEDDGSSAAEPEPIENDPLADVLPEGWTDRAPDALGQEAAQLIAAYRAVRDLGALESIRTSMLTKTTMSGLMHAGRSNELRQIEAAYAARKAELTP